MTITETIHLKSINKVLIVAEDGIRFLVSLISADGSLFASRVYTREEEVELQQFIERERHLDRTN